MGPVSAVVALPLPAPGGPYCHQNAATGTHYDNNNHDDDQPHLDDAHEALGDRLMALLTVPLPPDPPPLHHHNQPSPPPDLNVVISPPQNHQIGAPITPPLHHHNSSPQEPAVSVDRISCIVPATPTEFSSLLHAAEDKDEDDAVSSSPESGWSRTGHRRMFLSSCDLVCRSYPYINRIFFYATSDAADSVEAYNGHVASLKESLARTLAHFYPLAGRFATDAGGRLCVACNDQGVEFVEACVRDVPFNRLRDAGFQYSNLFWKLARRTELLRSDYMDQPILSVQVDRLLVLSTKFAFETS